MSSAYSGSSGNNRIYSIDYLRIVAFCGVVALHTIKPDGELSTLLNILSRFSVIFFFIIAGLFYNEHRPLRPRIRSLSMIGCTTGAIYCVLGIIGVTPWIQSLLSAEDIGAELVDQIVSWLVWNSFAPAYPLWFVFALLYVYIVYGVLNSCGVPKAAIASFSLGVLVARVIFCEFLGTIDFQDAILRSWLFFGLPCFSIGVLLKHFYSRLIIHKSMVLAIYIVMGIFISVGEYCIFGLQECYIGQIIASSAVVLFCCKHPFPASRSNGLLRKVVGGRFCLIAYLVHYAVVCACDIIRDSLELADTGFMQFVVFLATVILSLIIAALFICIIDHRRKVTQTC
ncbi:acyltransferase family protein [Collinsella intestinalis]|uniref:acyltransferase family protein n=1 Tax=Collinsella intestinalis TaxID=147207 RepID=UPI00195C1B61|nr:acyltransferase [Collinsella intestinalis]